MVILKIKKTTNYVCSQLEYTPLQSFTVSVCETRNKLQTNQYLEDTNSMDETYEMVFPILEKPFHLIIEVSKEYTILTINHVVISITLHVFKSLNDMHK